MKLFIRGERFPDGKIQKEKQPAYLAQSVRFITENAKSIELMQVNSRSYFMVVSEIYLNPVVANTLIEMNNSKDENGEIICPITHAMITEKLKEIVDTLNNVPFIKYEYSYFLIKVALADNYKYNPTSLGPQV